MSTCNPMRAQERVAASELPRARAEPMLAAQGEIWWRAPLGLGLRAGTPGSEVTRVAVRLRAATRQSKVAMQAQPARLAMELATAERVALEAPQAPAVQRLRPGQPRAPSAPSLAEE